MGASEIKAVLASMDDREMDELASALSLWSLDDTSVSHADIWLLTVLRTAAERRGIKQAQNVQSLRAGGM